MFKTEPALIIGALNALLALAVGFGLEVTGEQQGLIAAAVAAVLSVVVRRRVSPVATPPFVVRGAASTADLDG